MTFEEMVAQLTGETVEIGDFKAFADELKSAHETELGIHQLKISDLEADKAKADKEMTSLMRTNYDLMMSKPVQEPEPGVTENNDPPVTGVDSLFKVKES